MNSLDKSESYDNFMIIADAEFMIDEGGEVKVFTDNLLERLEKLENVQFNQFLPKLPIKKQTAQIDIKDILVKQFINAYGLHELIKDELKLQIVYDCYDKKELIEAVDKSYKKTCEFYKKYNNLIIELNK